MKVSPFETNAPRAERPVQACNDPGGRTVTAEARTEDEDEPRRDEPVEEPGYGHGV